VSIAAKQAVANVIDRVLSPVVGISSANTSRALANAALNPHPQDTQLFPAESYSLASPKSVQSMVDEIEHDAQIQTHPVSITDAAHTRVFFNGQKCLVKAADGDVVAQYNVDDAISESVTNKPCRRLQGTTMLLGFSPGANCYYHWLLDVLPRLGALQKAGFKLDEVDHFLVRNTNNAFQVETLAALGIRDDRVVHTHKKQHWHCDRLLQVNMSNGINMKMHRFVPAWLKHAYSTGSRNLDTDPIKLYVNRPKGVRRGISNEQALLPILEEFGYQIRPMEGLSFADQVKLMSGVDVLLSAHGGALSNMVFCRPGIRVGEVFGHHVYPYYYGLSQLCGHDYHVLMKDQSLYPQAVQLQSALKAGSHEAQLKTVTTDFEVDTGDFRLMLGALEA